MMNRISEKYCVKCRKECKQPSYVIVVKCPQFVAQAK